MTHIKIYAKDLKVGDGTPTSKSFILILILDESDGDSSPSFCRASVISGESERAGNASLKDDVCL